MRPGADNQHVAGVDIAALALEPERTHLEIDLLDVVHHDLGAHVAGLRLHLLHQPRPLDRLGETGIILDLGGDGELTTRLAA